MIEPKSNINTIDTSIPEGKMLIMAMAILTSMDVQDITDRNFGGMSNPYDVFEKIIDLTNKVYYEEEYKDYELIKKRDEKIAKVIN